MNILLIQKYLRCVGVVKLNINPVIWSGMLLNCEGFFYAKSASGIWRVKGIKTLMSRVKSSLIKESIEDEQLKGFFIAFTFKFYLFIYFMLT